MMVLILCIGMCNNYPNSGGTLETTEKEKVCGCVEKEGVLAAV